MSGIRVSRRTMLGSFGAASLAPVLPLDPGPDLPHARPAFAATLETGAVQEAQGGSRRAVITGGCIEGRRLSGNVRAGHIEWGAAADGAPVEVTTRLLVACPDGALVELKDRGVLPAGADPASHAAIPTTPELTGEREAPDLPFLLVGRLDASALARGVLKLQAFEVS